MFGENELFMTTEMKENISVNNCQNQACVQLNSYPNLI